MSDAILTCKRCGTAYRTTIRHITVPCHCSECGMGMATLLLAVQRCPQCYQANDRWFHRTAFGCELQEAGPDKNIKVNGKVWDGGGYI